MTHVPATTHPSEHRSSEVVQAHLAEYQALTTRNTYWITIQVALWPLLVYIMALISQARDVLTSDQRMWGAVLAVEVVVACYYLALAESYGATLYIESQLRPAIMLHLSDSMFWMWEPYLANRLIVSKVWYEYTPVLGAVVALGYTILAHSPSSAAARIGAAIAAIVVFPMTWLAYRAVKTRADFQRVARNAWDAMQAKPALASSAPPEKARN